MKATTEDNQIGPIDSKNTNQALCTFLFPSFPLYLPHTQNGLIGLHNSPPLISISTAVTYYFHEIIACWLIGSWFIVLTCNGR
ncbi:hypothetical protein L1987_58241 [Smallanthus sonchifolius]|uniref:Uncharacterized protein n=1 Tax=Smallanthus sonchifolius TaxID=185202 RepID=A0ACB9DF71_9ASTR|nr:hypothetical protein L1987_58241 [Smallanthus sonchifolius]